MLAIYNKFSNLVGWLDKKENNIYDENMEWLGFLEKGNVFSSQIHWLGGFESGTFIDKFGKPVAWLKGYSPQGRLPLLKPLIPLRKKHPLKPLKPLTPLRPLRPLTPLGGWSQLSWRNYWQQ